MTIYKFFLDASDFTFDVNLRKTLIRYSKGKIPKNVIIEDNKIIFSKLNKELLINSDPLKLCRYVNENIKKKKLKIKNIKESDIFKNKKSISSIIYHFTKSYQYKYNLSEELRSKLESFLEYEFSIKKITKDNFIILNNELIDIRGLSFSDDKFFILDK